MFPYVSIYLRRVAYVREPPLVSTLSDAFGLPPTQRTTTLCITSDVQAARLGSQESELRKVDDRTNERVTAASGGTEHTVRDSMNGAPYGWSDAVSGRVTWKRRDTSDQWLWGRNDTTVMDGTGDRLGKGDRPWSVRKEQESKDEYVTIIRLSILFFSLYVC